VQLDDMFHQIDSRLRSEKVEIPGDLGESEGAAGRNWKSLTLGKS
jgi:hypothetical protein